MFTRVPTDYRSDRRRPFTLILIAIVAIYLLLTALGTLWTDFLWVDSIGFEEVWQRRWGLSILLGALGIAVSFLVLWVSLRLVDRMSPRWAPFDLTEEEELIERFREWVEPRIRQIRFWLTGGLALLFGLTGSSWRDDVFMFINAQDFGTLDPIFGLDVGFYVFRLPLLGTVIDWVFNLLVLATVVVVIAHYFNGGVRLGGRRLTATRRAKTHISIMLALIALVRAVVYRMDMYELLFSDRVADQFFGPGYTDISARLPAYRLLILVAVLAAVLFIVNIFRPGWNLALVAVGSWLVVAIAAAAIYPAIIQRFQVVPRLSGRRPPTSSTTSSSLGRRGGSTTSRSGILGGRGPRGCRHRGEPAHHRQPPDLGPLGAAPDLSELPGAAQLLHACGSRYRSLSEPGHTDSGDAGGARVGGGEPAP